MSSTSERRHIVSAYDRELGQLSALVREMGALVSAQVQQAFEALVRGDRGLAQGVLDRERHVDQLTLALDEEVFAVIAKRQPAAVDLRLVLAIAKAAGDLERAGDKAARIAALVLRMLDAADAADGAQSPVPAPLQDDLGALHAVALGMLRTAVGGLASAALDDAIAVLDAVPRLKAAQRVLSDRLTDDAAPAQGVRLAALLGIAHALERVGNHAANIAEQLVYIITGEDVRYRNRELVVDALRHRALP